MRYWIIIPLKDALARSTSYRLQKGCARARSRRLPPHFNVYLCIHIYKYVCVYICKSCSERVLLICHAVIASGFVRYSYIFFRRARSRVIKLCRAQLLQIHRSLLIWLQWRGICTYVPYRFPAAAFDVIPPDWTKGHCWTAHADSTYIYVPREWSKRAAM